MQVRAARFYRKKYGVPHPTLHEIYQYWEHQEMTGRQKSASFYKKLESLERKLEDYLEEEVSGSFYIRTEKARRMDMIHLKIDGIPVEVEKDTTILQAARQIGVEIPTLCYLENVLPNGACRLCKVEVTNNGRTKLVTACTMPCSEGDDVQTMSDEVIECRRGILDLLLSDHRADCFSCEANGDCKLQEYCFEYGVEITSFEGERNEDCVDDTNKFFTYDQSKCILCHRCVNTCHEIVGRGAIDMSAWSEW